LGNNSGVPALPPGPTLPIPIQTVAYHRDPLGVLRRARARHGPVFTLRLALKGPAVVVADSADAKPLLDRDPGSAHAGEARRTILPMASERSVFGADDATYLEAHARLAAAFEPEVVRRRMPEMARIAAEHAEQWPRSRPFRLLGAVRTMVDEIFVRLVLGVSDERAVELTRAIGRMLRTPGNPPMPIPGEGDGLPGKVGAAVFERKQAPVSRLLAAEVEARWASGEPGPGAIGSILAAAPGLSPDAVADELIAILAAGQEPPSIALTWILDRLGRSPELVDPYLAAAEGDPVRDAIVRETLRLRPPASAGLRVLTEPATVGGQDLDAGTATMVPIPLLHRDPAAFGDPDRFDPGRWGDGRVDESAYLPFGWGARRCLGEHLARAYFDAVVPAVAERVRLRPLATQPERMVVRATVLVPLRSALVTARPR